MHIKRENEDRNEVFVWKFYFQAMPQAMFQY